MMEYFAVIDTETNWDNEVMSIGVVIAKSTTYEKIAELYYIFSPEFKVGGMYSSELLTEKYENKSVFSTREKAMKKIKSVLRQYKVEKIFSYNAPFDKNKLNELSSFVWFDIMRIAAYKQHNNKIPPYVELCKTGRMKRDYGVEDMMKLLSGDCWYYEIHNALCDAADELEIMRLLGKKLSDYDAALV